MRAFKTYMCAGNHGVHNDGQLSPGRKDQGKTKQEQDTVNALKYFFWMSFWLWTVKCWLKRRLFSPTALKNIIFFIYVYDTIFFIKISYIHIAHILTYITMKYLPCALSPRHYVCMFMLLLKSPLLLTCYFCSQSLLVLSVLKQRNACVKNQ